MKQIAAAAAIATALTFGMAAAGAAQTSAPHGQPAAEHAATSQAHNTAAPHHAATTTHATTHANTHASTHVSESRARRAALGAVAHGRVRSHRLTHVNGKRVYVYVLTVPGQSGTQHVTVDASNGTVVSNEHMAAAGAAHTHRAAAHTHTVAKSTTTTHHKR